MRSAYAVNCLMPSLLHWPALNLNIEQTASGAILIGVFRDQAELHGAPQAMQDFGVELVEVRQRSSWTAITTLLR